MKKMVLGSLILLSAALQPSLAAEVRTFPPNVYAQMKSAKHIGKIWLSPEWKGAEGFTVGRVQVAAEIDDPYTNVVDYLPYALRRIATPDSPNVLSMTVVEMSSVDRSSFGSFSATMGVEGQIVNKDGKLLMAFRTREEANDRETVNKNFELLMDKIIWSLTMDLGNDFTRALQVRNKVDKDPNASGLVPPPPPTTAQQSMDTKSRLLRLEELKQKGLINDEEYKAHKADILKGL
ncbi:MAG: SHOCT domain-containing protein [Holophaga sp.]|nr:SHOCT domain-containing protein [Holophaga sp.]